MTNLDSSQTAPHSQKSPLRWFTIAFLLFTLISMPVIVLLALLLWLLYYYLAGKQPKWSLRALAAKIDQMIEPPILLMACLLVAASLFVTTEIEYRTYAGFPFHYVTIYNYAETATPNWNVDGSLFTNVFLYYVFMIILRQIFWVQRH